MENFRTTFSIEKPVFRISHSEKMLFLGSCFSQNMGNYFLQHRFPACVNPFGVLFNPVSVLQSIEILLTKKIFTHTDLFQHNEQWHSFSHHSSFSNADNSKVLENINEAICRASVHLQKTRFLFLTFGSAWVYRFLGNKQIVSNCHKLPAKEFSRELLKTEEIVSHSTPILQKLLQINPKLQIIFTLSPVRHMSDGAHGNQISKATLLLAIDKLQQHFPNSYYFPAYEIILDDLRDYRFYDTDMVHPSQTAVEYIWKKLSETFFSTTTLDWNKKIEKINKALEHKAFNPNSEAHQKFIRNLNNQIKELEKYLSS